MWDSAFRDIDHTDELMKTAAKKRGVSAKDLAEYHNTHGFTAESLRQQTADDMGIPYEAMWHD